MTASSELATHFSRMQWHDIPPEHIAQLKRLVFDYLGVAISGSRTPTGRITAEFVLDMGGRGEASLIGRPGRVPAINAAFANAISEHSIELDDVDELALFHYGPPIVSAALAAAQSAAANGREFLAGLMAGCEALSRLSLACNYGLRDRGFHTTPACGVFGAAVAAGRLFRLDPEQMTSAIGLAGAQSSGLMEMYGPSMQKRFNPGPAARNGITAADLARRGFTGADSILDGERGFGIAYAGGIDVDRLLEKLGSEIPVIVEHKAYSAARPIHNGIDCALDVRVRTGRPSGDIVAISIRRHPMWAHYHLNASPHTFHEAQVSLPYSVAVAFVTGMALPPQYMAPNLGDDEVRRLSTLCEVVADPTLRRGVSCDMTVTFTDGTTARSVVDDPKGSVGNPMDATELRAKFDQLTGPVLGDGAGNAIAELIEALEDLSDLDELLALTQPAP